VVDPRAEHVSGRPSSGTQAAADPPRSTYSRGSLQDDGFAIGLQGSRATLNFQCMGYDPYREEARRLRISIVGSLGGLVGLVVVALLRGRLGVAAAIAVAGLAGVLMAVLVMN